MDYNRHGIMKAHILIFILFCFIWPAAGQTKDELLNENVRLKDEIQQLKLQLSESNNRVVEFYTRIKAAEIILRTTNADSTASQPTKNENTTSPVPDNSKSNSLNNESAKEVQKQEQGQCKAITKAGTRCSRKATEGSDFCWQHKSSTSTSTSTTTSTIESKTTSPTSTSKSTSDRKIYTGSRGGKYYINSNGNKTYIKQ